MLQIESVNKYLQAMGHDVFQLVKVKPQQAPAAYSRRELFQQFAKKSKTLAISSFTPANWRFNHNIFSLNKAFPEWNFYEIEMDKEKCNLCEICFKLCPKDVFNRQDDTLIWDLSKCNGCLLCQDVCNENAIRVKEHVHTKKLKEQKNLFVKLLNPSKQDLINKMNQLCG